MAARPKWRASAPHFALAYDYCIGVERGEIAACQYVHQACARQLEDLDRAQWRYAFDLESAEAICTHMERLPHVKGEWARHKQLIQLEPWQCFLLTTVFGWKHREDLIEDGDLVARAGTRRFRSVYAEMPRKQAKSTLAAGIGLFMTEADKEPGAEVYAVATTHKQASIVFDVARLMAKRAALGLEVRAHSIFDIASASRFAALHAQGETLDGLNIHMSINDELHAWPKKALYDVIETAMGARVQPLMFSITTAGDNLEGICYDIRSYAIRVLNGTIDDADSFFPLIYTIDQADREHWLERAVWKKANPNWGVSVYPWDMEAMAKKAREIPSEQNAFLTKRLNVWCNSSVAWMDMGAWQRGFDPKLSLDDFRGETCWAGIDLASKIDVNSLALLFKRNIGGEEHYYCFMRHWLPLAAVKGDPRGLYDGWVRMGALLTTPGNVVNIDAIEAETVALDKAHPIESLGVDPGHNSTQYGVHMAEHGIEVVDVRPNVLSFSEPMKWIEAWVKDSRFHHNCPVLGWMVSNVVAHRDHKDNMYPNKENESRKIDGVIALLIAINRMQSHVAQPKYEVFLV